MRDIDTTEVRLRRRHKTVVRMYRHGTTSSSNDENSSSEGDSDSSGHLERQNAVDNYTTSGESKVYSGVKYETGKRDSWNGTVYESFIDHGEDAGEIRYMPLHDSISSFCFVTECESPTRESFMIGSTPHRYIGGDNKNEYDHDSKIHLSTAKIHLLDIKQKSEQSQISSFEHKLSDEKWKNMGYEDLLHIDESIKPKIDIKTKAFQERHHSMPTQFVGNRFNVSSLTEIYIPSYKNHIKTEHNKNHIATPCNSFEDTESLSQASHSNRSLISQQRVEITIPSLNKITAEIPFDENEEDEEDDDYENVVRPKHNISEIFANEQGNSSPIHQPYPSSYDANKRCDSKFLPPATIYSSDSDSGIAAGSYTLSPSDQPFNIHRSFISHKCNNPYALKDHIASSNTILDSDNNEGGTILQCKQFSHDESLEGDNRTKLVINIESGKKKGCDNVYYSGLYAHWWKKENLPKQVIEAIANTSHRNDDDNPQHIRADDRGSGKDKMLKIQFMMLHFRVISFFFSDSLHQS